MRMKKTFFDLPFSTGSLRESQRLATKNYLVYLISISISQMYIFIN